MIEFLSFLKYRLSFLLFFCLSAAIIWLVLFLGNQDLGCARYISLLTGFFFVCFMYSDGARYFRQRRALKALSDGLFERMAEVGLPEPSDALEGDYSRLLTELSAAYGDLKKKLATAQNDLLEYYTLWVHQIKTPIAALRLILARAERGPNGETDTVGLIRQELFKIERYADMALRYIKLSDLASDLVIEKFSLGEVVHESVKKFGILFIYQRLSLEIEPMEAVVTSDKGWLAFILEQIISNAVKYTSTGGIKIYMENGRLVVKDSGLGIRPEDLPRVFAKGYTGYNGRLDGRASGLGLYLAKKAADALGLAIRIESRVGEGTKVSLEFPEPDEAMFSV